MKLSELKTEITSILRERSAYKLGTQEYTKKNLTPTDILDLAMAYSQVQGKGTTMWGNKMEKMIKVGNDLAKLNGTTQQDAKKRGNKPALILTLLKNKLVTKDEYITLYKDLLLKQTSVVKALKNADPAFRMVGGAAARAAHRDMKSESVVNEGKFKVDDLVYNKRTKTVGIVRIGDDKYGEVKTDADGNVDVDELEKYNPIKFKHQSKAKAAPSTQKEVSKRGLFNPFKNESVNERYSDFIKAKNLNDIIKLSKQKKNATFYVTDDNNSRIGTFYLKNGKFAKATGGNANYDLQNSKTKLKDRSDVIYKYKIDESVVTEMAMGFDTMTGLFYLQGVPFTRERMKEVILFMKNSKVKSAVNQFEYTPALIIKDKVGKQEVTIDPKNLKKLIEFYKKDSARLASDKGFK